VLRLSVSEDLDLASSAVDDHAPVALRSTSGGVVGVSGSVGADVLGC
jgi:hypothetical protein